MSRGDGAGKQEAKETCQPRLKKRCQRKAGSGKQALTRTRKSKASEGRGNFQNTINAHLRGECSVPTCRKEEGMLLRVTFNCHGESKSDSNEKPKER